MKIERFTDLVAWQEGHKLVLAVYKLTADFPQKETFALTDQMRRAAMSITNNIAEGFSRRSAKEKIQFYFMSLGSITELQNQCIIAKDLGYISEDLFNVINENAILVHKLLFGLIKGLRIVNS